VNQAGGKAVARASFNVEAPARSPAPWAALAVGALGAVAAARGRTHG
jgi:hypothetical protein